MLCSSCGCDLDVDAFSVDARVPRGRASSCKGCRAAKKRSGGAQGSDVVEPRAQTPRAPAPLRAPRVDGAAALDIAVAAHRSAEALLEADEQAVMVAGAAYLESCDPILAAEFALACDAGKAMALQSRCDLLAAQGEVRRAVARVAPCDDVGMRRCTCCARLLPVSHFAPYARGLGGLASACSSCVTVQREVKMDPDMLWQAKFRAERDQAFAKRRGGIPLESWALSRIIGNAPEDWESPVDVERRKMGRLGREKCSVCHGYFSIRGFGPLAGRCPDCAGEQVEAAPILPPIERCSVASTEIAMPSLNGADVTVDDCSLVDDWFGDGCA